MDTENQKLLDMVIYEKTNYMKKYMSEDIPMIRFFEIYFNCYCQYMGKYICENEIFESIRKGIKKAERSEATDKLILIFQVNKLEFKIMIGENLPFKGNIQKTLIVEKNIFWEKPLTVINTIVLDILETLAKYEK